MRALVRVIVPCYGYAGMLQGCVESVLRQEGVNVRVLIVDDCSPDETPAVAAAIMRGDRRVEYRRHLQNRGLAATANEGLEWAADGDYVVLLSADDMLVPAALWRATQVMGARPAVGMVYGHAPYFESGRPLPRVTERWRGTTVWPGREWIRQRCRAGHNCISSPEVVVRTSVQRRVGGYNPTCHHAGDLNMWLRVAAVSDVGYVSGAAQALYRAHPDSMLREMLGGAEGAVTDLKERLGAFEEFFADADDRLLGVERLRTIVTRKLARQALWQASRAYDRGDADAVESAERFVAFALDAYPDAQWLREWWGLGLRRRLGAGRSLWFLPFLATGAAHRLRSHINYRRWRVQGI
ncbi:MAG TPA: glycosyltransferase family A protein [Solirubrobacterales bacterium]|nr:glycosyltransferase family A protein [Solirubrobacterales bacterium]